MRTMSVALALVLLGPSAAHAQLKASDPFCRSNPASPQCPPPIRVQVLPPDDGRDPLFRSLSAIIDRWKDSELQENEDRRRQEAHDLDMAERRLRIEDTRRRLAPAPQPTAAPQRAPIPGTPELEAQIAVFIEAHSDWQQYGQKMAEYIPKLRTGETNVSEYLTLLYRLAKIDERLRADEFVARYSSPLVARVRAKYPTAYADTPNDDLEDAWLAKHPEYVDLASPGARAKLLAKHPEYADLAPPPAEPTPAPPTPEEVAQGTAFTKAYADWEQYAPKMRAYRVKLVPGETNATEYLTLLYRLAKMDAK